MLCQRGLDSWLPDVISACAATRPHALAIVSSKASVTYEQLVSRANQIANRLVKMGVGSETLVAVCLDRSIESIMGALAVMKAGGAYLPLDPKQPFERLAFMLKDARPLVVITRGDLMHSLGCEQLATIDVSDPTLDTCSTNTPEIAATAAQLAYVIYTSGSTGEPKGVEITHANLANLVAWHIQEFQVSAKDRATHLANVSFDASVWEAWPHLAAGATLYLPDDETRTSPPALRDWLVANEIRISFAPTPLAESLISLDWPSNTSLRFLLTGADTLHRHPKEGLPFVLVNNYGPTECTVVTTSGHVDAREDSNRRPTIGKPIANTTVYILDNDLRRVEPGAAGELCVGGAGVARGYRNRAQATSEKFIHDPFTDNPTGKLYRTGDLVRESPNGDLAYLGRIDQQIKILGHRIEPAEIETAINRHSAIASSVVVAHGADCSQKRLAAYVSMKNCVTPAAAELRDFLRSSLPDYMLPSLFVKVSSLPLTANGKVDRLALPAPTIENTLRDEEFVEPQSPIEHQVARVISDLLQLDSVSINDNFFMLGGHSLLGTQLIVKIRAAFGVDLTLRSLFEAPTVAELSSEIERLLIARVESMSEEEAQALLA